MAKLLSRRTFLALSTTLSASAVLMGSWRGTATVAAEAPSYGAQVGDVTPTRAVVWARGQSGARLVVDYSTSPRFERVQTRRGPLVNAATDYTGSLDLAGLQPGTEYYYQVRFVPVGKPVLPPARPRVTGRFRTAPRAENAAPLRFVWVADMCGQGWGRNPELEITTVDGRTIKGGYVIFDVIRPLKPDFAIFCGDMVYSDNACPPTQEIPAVVGGGTWINDPPKDFVAVSLEEFRENWKYNLSDEKFRAFLAQTPIYVQWDDHEVTNNWYPGEVLTAEPYNGIGADALAERARQAFFEYNPIRGERIYRAYGWGKLMEMFLLDERSFRGGNDRNTQPELLAMLGPEQLQWLKERLKASRSTWKVIATHDPLSIVTGGEGDYDAWSQNNSQVLGREQELADLLKFIKDEDIRNVVWITADVHFPAAIHYDPTRAVYQDFNPFWEFVIGPIHAGAFGPASGFPLDGSFGPRYEFNVFPVEANLPPPNNQYFGAIDIDARGALTARIYKITGEVVYEKTLSPV
ncbi:MAG: alkaline phosphatase D family protein [Aphanocapsa lilacina HA4352-LM1]|jgi:alkaline phosphatase D|nr:alkaline phosphatase D family protein [Aphanocapsa lilacina HA4352-LM1]